MEENRRDNHDSDFLDVFKKELTEKIQILEKGLSKLEYEYARENVELLIATVREIKQGVYRASFPVLVELSQAMEDVFSYIENEEQSLEPAHVDCLFQADAVFRSILRQENKKVSAWLIERESYIHRVIKVLWDFLEERGITPSDYQGEAEDGKDEYELAAEETREDTAEENEVISEAVAVTQSIEHQEELLPQLPPTDDSVSTATREPALQEEEEHETDTNIDVPIVEEEITAENTVMATPVPEINDQETSAANAPLFSDNLLRSAAECLVQTRRFRRHYPIFEEMKGADTTQKTMAVYYSAKGVRQHLEYLTEQLCKTIMRQNKVPMASMIHQFSVKISHLTTSWNKKVDFISEGDAVLLDARILTELDDILWHFLHAILIASAETFIEGDDGREKNIPISSLRLIAEEKMEMVQISLFIADYQLLEPGTMQQNDVSPQVNQNTVQSRHDTLNDRIISLGGAMDCTVSSKGTEIILQLPESFALVPCLPVQIQGASYALPLTCVERSLSSAKEILLTTNKGYEIVHDGERIMCIAGKKVFPPPETDNHHHDSDTAVVILKNGQMKYGLIVDTIMDEELLVLYPLDQRLGSIRGVLGTAMMADGSPSLIVDIRSLFIIVKNKTS